MAIKRDSSGWVDAVGKRWNGSSWVALTTAKRWSGSAWVDLLPLAAVASWAYELITWTTVTTTTCTVTASGGSGSYTYSWTKISGAVGWAINSPSAAATSFTRSSGTGTNNTAVFRCAVNDGVNTVNVDVTVEYSNGL